VITKIMMYVRRIKNDESFFYYLIIITSLTLL